MPAQDALLEGFRSAEALLLRRVEAEVGMSRALVGQLLNAEHLGLQRRAHRVQQIHERPIARPLKSPLSIPHKAVPLTRNSA